MSTLVFMTRVTGLAASELDVSNFLEGRRGGEVLILPDYLTKGFLARGGVIKALANTFHLPGTEIKFP